jgi:hypothetical protein
MKKILQALPIIVLLISVGFFIGLTDINKEEKSFQSFNSSVKTGTLISNNQSNISFKNVSLFGVTANRNNANDFAKKSVSLVLDRNALRNILASREKSITFTIPTGDALPMELELVEQKIFSDDFTSSGITGNSETPFNYTKGISYTGIIKGKEHSIASISIFNEFVMGVISDETGNYVLGSVKENNNYTDNYIFYNDNDLKVLNNFKCGVEDKEDRFARHSVNNNSVKGNQSDYDVVRAPVRIYFEADYRMYQDNGSNPTTLINFIQGMFASVATIYSNESIPMEISQIRYWTQSDPYVSMTETQDILIAFGNNRRDNFSGSLAQLLSTRPEIGGGIAWIAVLCIPYQADGSGRYSFSGIDPDYSNFPTYSWTVNVVAHELGHNFGSYHTHSCHWPTNGFTTTGAIDSCYTAEGFCFSSTRSNNNGTVMSYCHLNGAIRLSLGFGPMPGDTIRAWYNRASCLTGITNSSELPVVYDLKQNFPNPFNPSTTIRFLVPEDAVVSLRVYDVSGKEVANLINNSNYMPGFYDVNFNSSVFNLPSGPYFYKMTAAPLNGGNAFTQVKKMILIK